jgi:hypothetical protein
METKGEVIDEEDLTMQYDKESKTETFAGAGDRIMAGKPCENCNCGKKELFEGEIASGNIKALENGEIESACGKCYLGDAFRCASCPYSGKPAFEKGDKVKLGNAGVA